MARSKRSNREEEDSMNGSIENIKKELNRKSRGTKLDSEDSSEKPSTICSIINCFLALGLVYLFLCSINLLGDSFEVLVGRYAGSLFSGDSFISNPILGFVLGLMFTVLVQSSSSSTSIVVTLVAAQVLEVRHAVFIVMGANVGTSVSNTIVSLTQSVNKDEFRKAFAGATVHDIFNLLSVLVILPLEIATSYLYLLTEAIVSSITLQSVDSGHSAGFLEAIIQPLVTSIVQVNSSVITLAADPVVELEDNASMINIWCSDSNNESLQIEPASNESSISISNHKCTTRDFLLANTGLSDVNCGLIILFGSLIWMFTCMRMLLKILNSLLKGTAASWLKKVINTDFKYPFGWVSGYLAMMFGAVMTFLFQSSSAFTSVLTPLVGVGMISMERMYPLTLGSNLGTTTTAMLAALAGDSSTMRLSMQIALCHLFFNISGILLWYPIPFTRIPVGAAKKLGNIAANYRWFAVLYLIVFFFTLPSLMLCFSFINQWLGVSIIIAIVVFGGIIVTINTLQIKRPTVLPKFLRSWNFLPLFMHSFTPYDQFFTSCLLSCCPVSEQYDAVNDNEDQELQEIV